MSLFDNNTLYKIVTALKDKFVVTASLKADEKNKLELQEWAGLNNQKWAIRNVGDGKYAFFAAHNNGTMEVPKGATGPCQIEVNQPNKAPNEFFEILQAEGKFGPTAFQLKAFNGLVLDVCEGKAKSGQDILIYDNNGNKNQIFYIQPAE